MPSTLHLGWLLLSLAANTVTALAETVCTAATCGGEVPSPSQSPELLPEAFTEDENEDSALALFQVQASTRGREVSPEDFKKFSLRRHRQRPGTAQVGHTVATGAGLIQSKESCAGLVNQVSHFTVEVNAGTPAQKFDVVADTGSNDVIIPSCRCQQMHHCSYQDRCFDESQSSTFLLDTVGKNKNKVEVEVLTFGSGQIEAAISSENVRVGQEVANMTDGLLLMVDKALDIAGPFEGILGLGIPQSRESKKLLGLDIHKETFLERSGVRRFSMCFNMNADGVLRFHTPPPATPLASVGKLHWGLDFRGISVGDVSAPVQFCSASSMTHGMETPCGAIPDSGTTLLMAPKDHLTKLFASICDSWERCSSSLKHQTPSISAKLQMFTKLVHSCHDWMTESQGLNEMPPLHFRAGTSDGAEQLFELPAEAYVLETEEREMKYVTRHVDGILPFDIVYATPGSIKKVCVPAFGTHQYKTKVNGPIWIFGTPLFYRYRVGYDLSSTPPSMSFSEEPCGVCGQTEEMVLLEQGGSATQTIRMRTGRPRRHSGPVRLPWRLNTSLPL